MKYGSKIRIFYKDFLQCFSHNVWNYFPFLTSFKMFSQMWNIWEAWEAAPDPKMPLRYGILMPFLTFFKTMTLQWCLNASIISRSEINGRTLLSQCGIRMMRTLTVRPWVEVSRGLTNPEGPLCIETRGRLSFSKCDTFGGGRWYWVTLVAKWKRKWLSLVFFCQF